MHISLGGKNRHLRADRQILDSPRIGLQTPGADARNHKVKPRGLEEVKRQVFVVDPTGAQAMVEWAGERVEQSPLGLVVPLSCGPSGGRGVQRSRCPDRARSGQAS